MLGSSAIIAFVPASDLARARAFYEQTLGLRCLEQDAYACVFDAHGTMLRVTAVPEVGHRSYTVLGWHVADVESVVQDLTLRGVDFIDYDGIDQDPAAIWTTPGGDRVAWFMDPDGNTLSLTQLG